MTLLSMEASLQISPAFSLWAIVAQVQGAVSLLPFSRPLSQHKCIGQVGAQSTVSPQGVYAVLPSPG